MSDTICEHDRETLKWALAFTDGPDAGKARKWSPGEYEVCQAVADPAKLAEIMAERGRELGFEMVAVHHSMRLSCDAEWTVFAHWAAPKVCVDNGDEAIVFDMTAARAILLQWLNLPDGTRDGAENALRSVT